MTFEERLEAIAKLQFEFRRDLDTLAKIHLNNDREWRERHDRMDARINKLLENSTKDAENIRALARSAEMHERRLTDLEGGPESWSRNRPKPRRIRGFTVCSLFLSIA